jgi:hypothetical protein
MSDTWMIVVSTNPLAMPPRGRAEAAFALLCALRPEAQEPELHLSDTPQFFDCGSNFEGVFCPCCKADVADWWHGAMDRWWNGDNRRLLDVKTPCCGCGTTLNDLDYVWPQALACVALELMNPGPDLEPEERHQVERVLELPVRIIWRHI